MTRFYVPYIAQYLLTQKGWLLASSIWVTSNYDAWEQALGHLAHMYHSQNALCTLFNCNHYKIGSAMLYFISFSSCPRYYLTVSRDIQKLRLSISTIGRTLLPRTHLSTDAFHSWHPEWQQNPPTNSPQSGFFSTYAFPNKLCSLAWAGYSFELW